MHRIKSTVELSTEAFKDLKQFQVGKKHLIKTGREYIDKHIGGLMPSNLLLLGAASGVGKTHEYMRIMDGILSEELNPAASNYVTLEFLLEMKFLDLIVRDAHKITGKKKSEILTEEFSEEDKVKMEAYYKKVSDGRRFIVEESVTTSEFFQITSEFCEKHKDKEAIIISADHILLFLQSDRTEDPLSKLAEYTNILRKRFDNIYFIYLSQLNRSNYANIKDKSNLMVPNVSSIYGSSHFEFLSAYVIVMMNPFNMGVMEYMHIIEDRYPELDKFKTVPNDRGFVSFVTTGNIFYHTLKTRESDSPFDRLYIEKMDLSSEQLSKLKLEERENRPQYANISAPVFEHPSTELPVFDATKDIFD